MGGVSEGTPLSGGPTCSNRLRENIREGEMDIQIYQWLLWL
jgi:hypothetical protein